MTVPFRIGVLQLSMEPVEETVNMARACDAAGFDSFWLAEAYPWWRKHSMEARSSTAMTAVIARETTRIAIGWGIISPYTRHPVQIAMEARVLQDITGGGRFLLGLGASKIFMKEIGEGEKGKEVGPAVVMRESLEIIEAILCTTAQAGCAHGTLASPDVCGCYRPRFAAAGRFTCRRSIDGEHHYSGIHQAVARKDGRRCPQGRQRSFFARPRRRDRR